MAKETSPAFQFYPKEFLTDGNVAGMSLQERGAYITLICLCWQEGTIPSDPRRLANMVGLPYRAFARLWPAINVCFRDSQVTGRLVHPRLEKERVKQEDFRKRQAHAAASRWDKPNGSQPHPEPMPDACSPISDLRSPIPEEQLAALDQPASLKIAREVDERETRRKAVFR